MDSTMTEPSESQPDTIEVTVHIRRRPEIADPHGATVRRALRSMGHEGVQDVRLDRTIHLTLAPGDTDAIRSQVEEMCERLLANPVLEDYEVVVG